MSGDETLPEKLQQRFPPTFSKPTYTNGIGNRVKLLTISIPTLHCLLVLFASCWLRIQISRSDSHPVLIKSEHYRNSLFLIALRKLQKALFGKEKSEDIINSMLINYNLKISPGQKCQYTGLQSAIVVVIITLWPMQSCGMPCMAESSVNIIITIISL